MKISRYSEPTPSYYQARARMTYRRYQARRRYRVTLGYVRRYCRPSVERF